MTIAATAAAPALLNKTALLHSVTCQFSELDWDFRPRCCYWKKNPLHCLDTPGLPRAFCNWCLADMRLGKLKQRHWSKTKDMYVLGNEGRKTGAIAVLLLSLVIFIIPLIPSDQLWLLRKMPAACYFTGLDILGSPLSSKNIQELPIWCGGQLLNSSGLNTDSSRTCPCV